MTLSSTAVETAIAQCTSRWAMARGHRLNTSIVLAAVHGISGLFRTVSAVEPSLTRPLPTLSPSLIGHLASVDVKQHESRKTTSLETYSINIYILYTQMCHHPGGGGGGGSGNGHSGDDVLTTTPMTQRQENTNCLDRARKELRDVPANMWWW